MRSERWVLATLTLFSAGGSAAQAQTHEVTLGEAVTLALSTQPAVVQARGDVSVAHASKREALGSWLPSLSGTSSMSQNSANRFDPNTQRVVNAASTSYSAGISASLELFDGFRRAAQNRSTGAGVTSADAALLNQRFQVTLQTKQAFYGALFAAELVNVAEARVQRATEQLRIAREKLAAGSAIRSDTLRSRVELGNAALARLNAQTQQATAEANLARLIGFDGMVRARADSTLYSIAPLDTAALRVEAARQAPAIAQADAQARVADAQVAVARAQYFPSVSASYSNSFAGNALGSLNNSWTARLQLSWPLFNGFTRETAVSRSTAGQDAALARAADARRQVNAQLTQQLATLAAAAARIEIAAASLGAADEDLRVQRERYRLGAATIIDVLTAEVNLDQAAVDGVQARQDYLVAKAAIEALIGREL